MDIAEFFDKCEKLDWYFNMSDDYSKFIAGQKAYRTLREIAKTNPKLSDIWQSFYAYHHTGPAYGTKRAPMPVRPYGQLTLI